MIKGPWSVVAPKPSPTTSRFASAANFVANSSTTDSCTMNRCAHTHVCPLFRNLDKIAPFTAASMLASGKTMNGALPPSSNETFFTVAAHFTASVLPTSVEPVNDSFRTTSLEVSASPMAS